MFVPESAPGFYMLVDQTTRAFYIGSSVNLMNRIRFHRNHIRNGTHPNSGIRDNFDDWSNVELVVGYARDKQHALDLEQELLDKFVGVVGCCNKSGESRAENIIKGIAGTGWGSGRKHSEETKKYMSAIRKGIPRSEPKRNLRERKPGKIPTAESRSRMAAAKSKPVSIMGVGYDNILIASAALGKAYNTVKNRVLSEKDQYKDWFYLNQVNNI